jgi:proteasome beta subunit
VAVRSVKSAVERDTASGNGVNVAEITAGGVEIDEYETFDDLL